MKTESPQKSTKTGYWWWSSIIIYVAALIAVPLVIWVQHAGSGEEQMAAGLDAIMWSGCIMFAGLLVCVIGLLKEKENKVLRVVALTLYSIPVLIVLVCLLLWFINKK